MTHEPKRAPDDWLDDLLDDVAKAPEPDASPQLMARILADAEHVMPPPGGVPATDPLWHQIVRALGGWGALGGLAVAGITGLAIGLGAFDAVGMDAVWSTELFDTYDSETGLSAFGWYYEEG